MNSVKVFKIHIKIHEMKCAGKDKGGRKSRWEEKFG
jgi:hypothetical protein